MTSLDAGMAKTLRSLIANTIADEKAYNVPGVCKRYGLADGDGTEAFASKYRYVHKRLHDLPPAKVLSIARALYQDEPNFELGEAIAQIDEKGSPPVTEVTRRRLAISLNTVDLSGDIKLLEFLKTLWPLSRIYREGVTMEDIVIDHCLRNDDMTNQDLLEMLGFYTCSRKQVFRVLEALVAPVVRLDPASQAKLVGTINHDLRADGYAVTQAGKISGSPRFLVRRLTDDGATPADDEIAATLSTLSETDIHERWTKALERRKTDPGGAITLARTLLEDVCKGILSENGEAPSDKDDLPVCIGGWRNS